MVRIGVVADKLDQYPEWSNVYDVLDTWMTTHDAGGLSERDIELARHIDEIVGEPSRVRPLLPPMPAQAARP